jgi:hypothetical protein
MESLLYVFQWVHRKASPCAQVDLAGNIPVIAKIPARCGQCQKKVRQCQKKVPAVSSLALWCAGCFSPEELQLQLCRTCHPSTRDLLDKALPSYEDHCAQNFELLSNMTPITGDEPALRLSPLHGGSWMTSASDGHHVGLTRCLDKHGPVTDAPKRGVCYGWLLGP